LLAADTIDAEEAYRIGLVTAVFDDVSLGDEVHRLARRLGGYPAASVSATKRAFRATCGSQIAALLDLEEELALRSRKANDRRRLCRVVQWAYVPSGRRGSPDRRELQLAVRPRHRRAARALRHRRRVCRSLRAQHRRSSKRTSRTCAKRAKAMSCAFALACSMRRRNVSTCFHAMHRDDDGSLLATAEMMLVHVDRAAGRSVAFAPEVAARLEALARAHTATPWPAQAGRSIRAPVQVAHSQLRAARRMGNRTNGSTTVWDPSATYDVLVLGGGNAGLCAALSARRAGCSVLVVESAPIHFRGGNSRHTRNLRCMHDAPADVLTDAYPEDEYWQDLLKVTGGRTNETLARMTIRHTATCRDWMIKHGVRFQPSLGGTLHVSRTNAFFLGGGKALLNAYYRVAEAQGVQVLYDTEVMQSERRGRRFTRRR
jgi:hypothetical protein